MNNYSSSLGVQAVRVEVAMNVSHLFTCWEGPLQTTSVSNAYITISLNFTVSLH